MHSSATTTPDKSILRWLLDWTPDNTLTLPPMSDGEPEEPEPEDYFPGAGSMFVYSEEDLGDVAHELFALLQHDPQLDYNTAEAMYVSNIAYKLLTGRMNDSPELEEEND
jgi:hypothetical protein